MDDELEQLMRRYGQQFDYSLLTPKQRELLLDSTVRDHKDVMGSTTVRVTGISRESEGTLLDIIDQSGYHFRAGQTSTTTYERERKPIYVRILRVEPIITDEPKRMHLFTLEGAQVRVQFDAYRERA